MARYRDLNSWRTLLAAIALVGCTAADVPELYHGRAGRTVLAVPSRVAWVLYDGESDWKAPEKPKAQRTDRDPIRTIEFDVDLDHPDSVLTNQAARDRRLERSEMLHLPAVFGHILGITVDLPAEGRASAATLRSHFSTGTGFPSAAFRALKPVLPEYGLETRRADWSKPVKERKPHGAGIFDVDVDYLSTTQNTYIFCNDGRQDFAPFAPMPTCQFTIFVPELGGWASGAMDRGDVPRWRDLRAAVLATLRSFVVVPR